ncbi:MAG: tetratricopeptide repeat protein [Bacteroidetes bacterium]|nr:tetratricopeptide repeat protein [Bacteroidota bacterium]
MKTKLISLLLLFMLAFPVFAQKENTLLRKGNSQYNKGNFKEAEKDYRKALEINKESVKGKFNLGTAVYEEKNFEESAKMYNELAGKNQDKDIQAKVYHNMGNSFLEAKQYDKSILAYKNALMNNPSDLDTKYNLEYAKMMLKKQQDQQKKDQDKKNKDKQDQKKDQQKKDQDKQDQKNQPPQDQKKLSKEDAARMLEALKNDEKKTLQKVKKEKAKVQVIGIEKDW